MAILRAGHVRPRTPSSIAHGICLVHASSYSCKRNLHKRTPIHSQGHSVVADLLNVSEAKRTVEEAVQKMGGLDILVNCGGVWTDAILSDHLGEQGFTDAFKMHIMTPAQLIEEAMPHLSKTKVIICHFPAQLQSHQTTWASSNRRLHTMHACRWSRQLRITQINAKIILLRPHHDSTEISAYMAFRMGRW